MAIALYIEIKYSQIKIKIIEMHRQNWRWLWSCFTYIRLKENLVEAFQGQQDLWPKH